MKQASIPTRRLRGETPALARQSDALRDLVRQVVQAVHPLRIILFGSRARGDAKPDSDYDLLIVMPEGADCGETTHELYNRVGHVDLAYDLIVATPGLLEKYKNNCALVYKWALREGRVVYDPR